MAIDPITGAVISGVLSIGQGLFGASQAQKENDAAKRAAEKAQALAKENTKISNKYNKELFKAEREDYYAQRDYQYQIAVQNWEYGKQIQDFEYQQAMRQYAKSVGIYEQQLNFNDLAADISYANESAALAGLFTQQATSFCT